MLSFFKSLLKNRMYLDSNFPESKYRRFLSSDLKKGGSGEKIFVNNFFTSKIFFNNGKS